MKASFGRKVVGFPSWCLLCLRRCGSEVGFWEVCRGRRGWSGFWAFGVGGCWGGLCRGERGRYRLGLDRMG